MRSARCLGGKEALLLATLSGVDLSTARVLARYIWEARKTLEKRILRHGLGARDADQYTKNPKDAPKVID